LTAVVTGGADSGRQPEGRTVVREKETREARRGEDSGREGERERDPLTERVGSGLEYTI